MRAPNPKVLTILCVVVTLVFILNNNTVRLGQKELYIQFEPCSVSCRFNISELHIAPNITKANDPYKEIIDIRGPLLGDLQISQYGNCAVRFIKEFPTC